MIRSFASVVMLDRASTWACACADWDAWGWPDECFLHMRPGAALIEIFPCRFGDEHQRNYFWHPSHAEMQTFAFQIFVTDEAACKPSELQKHPEGEAR